MNHNKSEVTLAYETAEALIRAGKPVLLLGMPGTGKTERLRQIGLRVKDSVHSIIASHHDALSFLGAPRIEGDRTIFCPPVGVLPAADQTNGLFIIDEVSDALLEVQNVLCSLLTEQRVGMYQLPAGTALALGGNRAKDRSGAGELVTKLANRVAVLELPDTAQAYVDDWMAWSRQQPDIPVWFRAAVDQDASTLLDFDPKRRVNATPRSLTELARFANALDLRRGDSPDWDVFSTAGRGYVGAAATARLITTAQHLVDSPTLSEILDAPNSVRIPTQRATLLSLVYVLGEAATWQGNSHSNLDALCTYMHRVSMNFPELGTSFIYALASRRDDRFDVAAFASTNKGDVLSALGRACGMQNHKDQMARWAAA